VKPHRPPPFPAALLAACITLAAPVALAATASHQGAFVDDDAWASFAVAMPVAGSFSARTWHYSGGTQADGRAVAGGGFAAVLTLTDITGEVLYSGVGAGNDSVCQTWGEPLPASGYCWDTGLQMQLAAGSYLLFLSQDGNTALGINLLVDGFSRSGQSDYTAVDHLGLIASGLRFVQVDGSLRSGAWALDIATPMPSPVPAPPTAWAMACGLGLLAARRRRPQAAAPAPRRPGC
jgi:MYXO-CTERM domain-containing protein